MSSDITFSLPLMERMKSMPLFQRIDNEQLTYKHFTNKYFYYDKRGTRFNDRVSIPFCIIPKGKLTKSFYSEANYASSPCDVCFRLNKGLPKHLARIDCIVADSFDCCATCLCADIPCDRCNWKRLSKNMRNRIESLANSPPRYASNTPLKSKRAPDEEMQIKGAGSSSTSVQILGSSNRRKRQKSEQTEPVIKTSINLAEDDQASHQTNSIDMAEDILSSPIVEQSDLTDTQDQIMLEENMQPDKEELAEINTGINEEMNEIKQEACQEDPIKEDIIKEDIVQQDTAQQDLQERIKILLSEKVRYDKAIKFEKVKNQNLKKELERANYTIDIFQKSVKGQKEENIRDKNKYKELLQQKQKEFELEQKEKEERQSEILQLNERQVQMEFDYTKEVNDLQGQIASLKSAQMYSVNNAKAKSREYEEVIRQKNSALTESQIRVQASEEDKKRLREERDAFEEGMQKLALEIEQLRKERESLQQDLAYQRSENQKNLEKVKKWKAAFMASD